MRAINIGVIPAAGEGNRLGYLGKILPKPLLPIYDKPIIHHIVQNMKKIGVKEVFIPIYYQKNKIKEYFNDMKDHLGVNVNFIELEKLTSGIAMTIDATKNFINEPFIVILGDDLKCFTPYGTQKETNLL